MIASQIVLAFVTIVQEPPYPPSAVIAGVDWDRESHAQFAMGSDQWPMTTGADGQIYAAWGDGWGWGRGREEPKRSIGVTRIEGEPPALEGVDLWGDGPGQGYAKPEALIAIDDRLVMFWTSGDSRYDEDDTRASVSLDGGRTWDLGADRAFPGVPRGFRVRGICQFGPGYRGARDGFAYVYFGHNRASDLFLARVPKGELLDADRYEWFAGLEEEEASWSGDVEDRRPAFRDDAGFIWHVGVSYLPAIDRYLLVKPHYAPGDDRDARDAADSGVASLGVFDAPSPWGPWSTVFYEDDFIDDRVKFTYMIPTKFLGDDGRSLWLAWSGWPEYDNVNFIRGTLRLRAGDPGAGDRRPSGDLGRGGPRPWYRGKAGMTR